MIKFMSIHKSSRKVVKATFDSILNSMHEHGAVNRSLYFNDNGNFFRIFDCTVF